MEKKQISAKGKGMQYKKYWNTCVGAGRAAEGLRAKWQEQLETAVQECGFQYIRFHGLLCDEMGIYKKTEEKETYNYAYVDMLFDALLRMKIRPFVEFGFMPEDLASGEGTQFWWKGNVTPPKDYDAWGRLLENLIAHWVERYGIEEVQEWYFEVWNEPNLSAFWKGTKTQYFELYKVSAKAVKRVSEKLRVGGPATSNFVPDTRFDGETENFSVHKTHLVEDLQSLEWKGVWLEDFLEYCEKENLPVDFVSTHPYPTDFALDGQEGNQCMRGRSRYVHSTRDDLQWIRRLVKESAYPHAEIHMTEWSSSPTSRDCSHDSLPVAAYIVKCNLEAVNLVDSLSYWTFTDIFEEAGPGPEAFHGGFGLMNMNGIKKPSYHAYRFLNQLGNTMLLQTENLAVTRNETGKIRALFYNYPNEIKQSVPISEYPTLDMIEKIKNSGSEKKIELDITDLQKEDIFVTEILSTDSGDVMEQWKAYGKPQNLSWIQERNLMKLSENLKMDTMKVTETGILHLELMLKPWEVVLLEQI